MQNERADHREANQKIVAALVGKRRRREAELKKDREDPYCKRPQSPGTSGMGAVLRSVGSSSRPRSRKSPWLTPRASSSQPVPTARTGISGAE